MIIADISPGANIEWLWTLDLVDLSWEILRYRCLKQKTLEAFRLAAVEALLQRVEGLGLSFSDGRYLQQAHQLFLSDSFFGTPRLLSQLPERSPMAGRGSKNRQPDQSTPRLSTRALNAFRRLTPRMKKSVLVARVLTTASLYCHPSAT
jgi:hypothetical protein